MSTADFGALRANIETLNDEIRSHIDVKEISTAYDKARKVTEQFKTLRDIAENSTQNRVAERLQAELGPIPNLIDELSFTDKINYGDSNVYVIRLDPGVLTNAKFKQENSHHNPSKPCVYVGMTGHTPEERFNKHKAGYKSNKYAKHFGKELMPEIYDKFNPMSHEHALVMEPLLAEHLKRQGYAVWQR